MTRIKICGISRFCEVEYVNEFLPDFVGFVFAPSRRKVDFNKAFLLRSELDPRIKTVGVFVNEDIDFIRKCCDRHLIDCIQLHGCEDRQYIDLLRKAVYKPIIKAIRVQPDTDLAALIEKEIQGLGTFDFLLFDTYSRESQGGTGKTFDWSRIPKMPIPYFLAGGLNTQNLPYALETVHPYGVDISSGVEEGGIKQREKIAVTIRLIRDIDSIHS
jgi:phosphoribosylanthranilate isomerase